MAIQVGEKIPDVPLSIATPDGPQPTTSTEFFGGKRVALFAVPGAFTPTCHRNHLPGYVSQASAIKAKGVDAIVVTAVNDVFVMDAWAKASGAGEGQIEFISDGNGDFAKALGLTMDGAGFGLGTRSQRYSMVVEDGVVKALNVEDAPSKAQHSGAENLLKDL